MIPLAHSARPDRGIPAQTYADHVGQVFAGSAANASGAGAYSFRYGELLAACVQAAALFHDLGKLDPANQAVLALASGTRGRLPVNHVDAGVAHLLPRRNRPSIAAQLAAAVIYAHHRGLPAVLDEEQKGDDVFRDTAPYEGHTLCRVTDERLPRYLAAHHAALPGARPAEYRSTATGIPPLLARLALSCLVDADHGDTARHYGQAAPPCGPALRPDERLAALDAYIGRLASGRTDERTALRSAVYAACRDADVTAGLVECDSPVGSGKTTAVMAHLLRAAHTKGLRRLFVVLPFINIIDQSVKTYRKCLVLPGEQRDEVIAAHHHRAEYADPAARQFSALWHAPIVVTTAVQFFETLAACQPAALRKLHQLAGAGVFIDESHASLPAALWPRAWDWLDQLVRDWNCHIVFGSGSLNRVWRLREFVPQPVELPALVRADVRERSIEAESRRIQYRTRPDPISLEELATWVLSLPGPRVVIVNTVQTAAALARHLSQARVRKSVEHLSTALTPRDRARTLGRVRRRLGPGSETTDWTLVATSCVEAGVDVSFRIGFRERSSLSSLVQVGGRVNRSAVPGIIADVWDFQLRTVGLVRENPGYRDSARVLGELFAEGRVGPEFCTEALTRELRLAGRAELNKALDTAEKVRDFPEVQHLFRVIDEATVTAVIDRALQERLDAGEPVDWQELQQSSVQIYADRADRFAVREFRHFPGVMAWTLGYDDFLGYMAGVLPLLDAQGAGFIQ